MIGNSSIVSEPSSLAILTISSSLESTGGISSPTSETTSSVSFELGSPFSTIMPVFCSINCDDGSSTSITCDSACWRSVPSSLMVSRNFTSVDCCSVSLKFVMLIFSGSSRSGVGLSTSIMGASITCGSLNSISVGKYPRSSTPSTTSTSNSSGSDVGSCTSVGL